MARREELGLPRLETDEGNMGKASRIRADVTQQGFGAISGFFRPRNRTGFSFDAFGDQRASNVLHAPRLTDPQRAAGGGGLIEDLAGAEERLRRLQGNLGTTALFPENFSRV